MTLPERFAADKSAAIEKAVSKFRQSLTDLVQDEGIQTFDLDLMSTSGQTPSGWPCKQVTVSLVSVPAEQPK